MTLLAAALALALPAAVMAQNGPEYCPDGVMEKGGPQLTIKSVQANQVTYGGFLNGFSAADVRVLSDVSGSVSDWDHAILYFGVRGYGYSTEARDARSFGDTFVQVEDGDLIHGVWLHVGKAGRFVGPAIGDGTFKSLEPSTKYVAQLVVGKLKDGEQDVTNDFVSGKPVMVQKCFQTLAVAN